MTIHQALVEVMRAIPAVRKEDRNSAQGFDFRGIDAVINAVGPALREHGVLMIPEVLEHRSGTVEVGKNKTVMSTATVLVKYTFYASDGSSISAVTPGTAFDAGDKAYPKAMSIAWRTALLQALSLPTDDRDPDHDIYERSDEPIPSDRDQAEEELLAAVRRMKLNTGDVARLFLAEVGRPIAEEADAKVIRSFTERLDINERK